MSVTAPRGFALAMELFDFAVELERNRFLRRNPGSNADQADAHVQAWLSDRRGAPIGDSDGHSTSLSR